MAATLQYGTKKMKTFRITSPAYKANGFHGTYVSLAITDDAGNIIKGFGDHISEASYGIKNVYDAQGQTFSDDDRLISIEEVEFSEADFDNWVSAYNERQESNAKIYAEMEKRFGVETYLYIYCDKKGQEERAAEVEQFRKENPIQHANFYSFLEIVK